MAQIAFPLRLRVALTRLAMTIGLLLAIWSPAHATANAPIINLNQPCVVEHARAPTVAAALALAQAGQCRVGHSLFDAGRVWSVFLSLDLPNSGPEHLQFRFTSHFHDRLIAHVVFADGKVAMLDPAPAVPNVGTTVISRLIPLRAGPVVAIVVDSDGLQNQRSSVPNAAIATASGAREQDMMILGLFALCGGALLALFIYNAAFAVILRYRFVHFFTISAGVAVLLIAAWSGVAGWLFPGVSANRMGLIVVLLFGLYLFSVVGFMLSFLERGMVSRRMACVTVATSGLAVVAIAIRVIDHRWMAELLEQAFYWLILATLALMSAVLMTAIRRGSRAAMVYGGIWAVPIAVSVARVLWGFGAYGRESVLMELSALFIVTLEAAASAVAVGWRVGQLRSERDEARSAQKLLRELAERDPLSGLLNRRAFIERAVGRATESQLILIDVDHFKSINDAYGHDMGDQVLVSIARTLTDHSPPDALVGRVGGEEFAVITSNRSDGDLADRLCQAIAQPSFRGGPPVTVSAGVAVGAMMSERDWRMLYISADTALYNAKRRGRNRVERTTQSRPVPVAAVFARPA